MGALKNYNRNELRISAWNPFSLLGLLSIWPPLWSSLSGNSPSYEWSLWLSRAKVCTTHLLYFPCSSMSSTQWLFLISSVDSNRFNCKLCNANQSVFDWTKRQIESQSRLKRKLEQKELGSGAPVDLPDRWRDKHTGLGANKEGV